MESPPILGTPPPAALIATVARWRTVLMLLLLAAYPVVLGVVGLRGKAGSAGEAALPSAVSGLLLVSAENLGVFAAFFLLIWLVGRPGCGELWADRRCGTLCWAFGFGYSIALRVALGLGAAVILGVAVAVLQGQGKDASSLAAAARPKIENLLDPAALQNPVYLALATTLVSFGVAGLREELWRAALLAAALRLLPGGPESVRNRIVAVVFAAVVFGLGHLPQGWGGVLLTGGLGIGLGAIIVFHRSLWVAVIAHGFFDATSLLLLRAVYWLGLQDQLFGK